MAKVPQEDAVQAVKAHRKALSPDARENQLIGLAMDTAEERMRNGTASSQEIVHFLRLGSSLVKLQKTELEVKVELEKTKIKAYEAAEEYKKLYEEAIEAMRSYSGSSSDEYDQ
jgi:hypothetical protein